VVRDYESTADLRLADKPMACMKWWTQRKEINRLYEVHPASPPLRTTGVARLAMVQGLPFIGPIENRMAKHLRRVLPLLDRFLRQTPCVMHYGPSFFPTDARGFLAPDALQDSLRFCPRNGQTNGCVFAHLARVREAGRKVVVRRGVRPPKPLKHVFLLDAARIGCPTLVWHQENPSCDERRRNRREKVLDAPHHQRGTGPTLREGSLRGTCAEICTFTPLLKWEH